MHVTSGDARLRRRPESPQSESQKGKTVTFPSATRNTLPFVAVSALLLAGCAADGSEGSTDGNGQDDLELSFQIGSPTSLNPLRDIGSQIGMAMCANLVELNKESQEFENLAAASVESDDAQQWTITLHEDWTFHDGSDVTAHSYVDAWNEAATGANAWQSNGTFSVVAGYSDLNPTDGSEPESEELSGLDVVDDHTFTVQLNEPNADFPKVLSTNSTCPLPEVAFDDMEAFEDEPIGNGPYKFAERVQNQHVTLERWEDFPGDDAFSGEAHRLVAQEYTSPDSAYTDFSAGNLDMIRNVPANTVSRAQQELDEEAIYEASLQSKQYRLNVPDYVDELSDPNLRKAISYAIDRQTLVDSVLDGHAVISDSLVTPDIPSYSEAACEACEFDPETAQQLYSETDGLDQLTIHYNEDDQQVVEAIGRQINETLGIEINYDPMMAAMLSETNNNQELEGLSFGLWGWSYRSPDQYMSTYETGGSGNQVIAYSNDAVDEMISEARGTQGEQERNELYADAEQVVLEDQPTIPLFIPIDYGLQGGCAAMNDVQGDIQFYRADSSC